MLGRPQIYGNHTLDTEFVVSEVYATLSALVFCVETDGYPAVSEWLRDIFAAFSEERKKRSYLLFKLHVQGVWPQGIDRWLDFDAYIAWIARQDATTLRDTEMSIVQETYDQLRHEDPALPAITPDTLLEDNDTHKAVLNTLLQGGKLPYQDELFAEKVRLMRNPEAYQMLLVEHLTWSWESVFKPLWQEHAAHMQRAVTHLQTFDVTNLSLAGVVRTITGRDITSFNPIKDLKGVRRVTFIPTFPIGPYLTFFDGFQEGHLIVTFETRDPMVFRQPEAHLSRSELLVRLNSLADDTRLRILALLTEHDELASQEVITLLGLSQSAASRHLRQLSMTGYLIEKKRETAKVYALNAERINETLQAVRHFLNLSDV